MDRRALILGFFIIAVFGGMIRFSDPVNSAYSTFPIDILYVNQEFYYKNQTLPNYFATHATNFTGPPGPQGSRGYNGTQGIQGIQGPIGYNGTKGIQGPQGERGYNGTQGIQGIQGFNGTQGIQGPIGYNGTQGVQGNPGVDGNTWYSGSGAPDSGLGVSGDYYLNTATNDVYKKTTSWGIIINIKGLTGDTGAAGTSGYTWYSGTTVPDNGNGVNGDFYLRTTTSDVYKKAAGAWSIILNIKGLTGDTGPKGDTGDPGPSSFDVNYYRHYGTTTYESWYTSPRAGTALAGTALVANRMYAMPFITPKAITIDQIGIYVSTLSTTTARLGIYNDNGNCYPSTLLLDAGTVDVTATGAKKLAINQALGANKLYWLVIVCAATPAIYCIPVAAVINVLGTSSALGTAQNAGLYVAQTYGVLPGTFPSSPTMIIAAPIPAIFVRLSA